MRSALREDVRARHNGMTYDADLNLIVCEHATSSLVREHPDGRRDVLASHFEGQELNSPNDVCVRLLLDHERGLGTTRRSNYALQNVSVVTRADAVIAAFG